MKAYKLRLYPDKENIEKLELALEVCRQTYNNLLSELNEGYTKNEIQNWLLDLKVVNPVMEDVHSKVLQMENQKLFSNLSGLSALKKNGKKVGRLRYRGKGWFKTFTYNQSGFKLIKTNNRYDTLHLSKIGDIKIFQHRKVKGNIKQITIKKSIDKWYATLVTDHKEQRMCGNKEIGIDLGINHYLVDSEENYVEHPKFFEENKELLRQAHKNLSRKKLRSKNRLKARKILAKTYERINNKRDDFLHKLSTKYIDKCKIIVVEDLNIKQMMEQKYYNAKNIADSSWGKFSQFLTYKAESAGCKLVKIDPRNTTKCCSGCDNIQNMPLHKRMYNCNCGLSIDRDYNSAINIHRLGMSLCGDSIRPLRQLSEKQEAPFVRWE